LREAALALGRTDPDLATRLADTLADELPLLKRDGRFVREGFDPALDELRLLQVDSRKVIAQLQARYAAETDCRTLRIKHNSMLGYFVEVPQAVGETFLREPWRAVFVHRQTMSDAMRFSSVELGELEAKIASAADRALKLELSIFAALTEAVLAQAERSRRRPRRWR
jgi:DNA mismatch repair protein MutS